MTLNHIRVSVIIPLYNSSQYVLETIHSVLQQTFTNLEIIIVDDHSTDDSYDKVKSVPDERILLLKNPEKGACAARNFGFKSSSGDLIQFLDADDLLSPDKIQNQVSLYHKHGSDHVFSCSWAGFTTDSAAAKLEQRAIDKSFIDPKEWLSLSWTGNGSGQTGVWLTPRHLVEKAGLWDESLLINQDGEFFCRVLLCSESIYYDDSGIVYYRKNVSTSISSNVKSFKKAQSLLDSYEKYVLNFGSINLTESLRRGLAHNFLTFIYLHYHHKELRERADFNFRQLGFKKYWPVGGRKIKKVAETIGMNNALKLRALFL